MQQSKKIEEGYQIINELNSCISDIGENFDSQNSKKHYEFVLNFRILQILSMLHLKSLDTMNESFDVFSIFSSKSSIFEKLKQINNEKKIQRKVLVELTKSLTILAEGKSDLIKKASKRTKDFNKLLMKFLQIQKEKFALSSYENDNIQKMTFLFQKISLNEIAIIYHKSLIEKNDDKIIVKKSEKQEKEKSHSFKKKKNDRETLINYEAKIKKRLDKINSSFKNLMYDALLFSLKIVYFGPFDQNYQYRQIKLVCETFLEDEIGNISQFWLQKNDDLYAKYFKFLLEISDIYMGNYKFFNAIPLSLIYELNLLVEVINIENICLWDPLNIFDSLSLFKSFIVYHEPLISFEKSKNCFILHHQDPYIKNKSCVLDSIFSKHILFSKYY